MNPTLAVLLVLFLVAFAIRVTIQHRPSPRSVPGEGVTEQRIMLLGTFRVYTWLVWVNLALAAVSLMSRETLPGWLVLPALASALLLMITAHSVYWRLGYDHRRWLLVLGHLSGAFALAETLYGLRQDIQAYLEARERAGDQP